MSRSHKPKYRRSTPSWWNRLFNNVPKKRKDRALERKILKGEVDPEVAVFEHAKRPHMSYYW